MPGSGKRPDDDDPAGTLQPLALEGHGEPDTLPDEEQLEWGPWCVPGLLDALNNAVACVLRVDALLGLLAAGDARRWRENEL